MHALSASFFFIDLMPSVGMSSLDESDSQSDHDIDLDDTGTDSDYEISSESDEDEEWRGRLSLHPTI